MVVELSSSYSGETYFVAIYIIYALITLLHFDLGYTILRMNARSALCFYSLRETEH